MIKKLFHFLREKERERERERERNIEFLPDICLLFKMKMRPLTVLACNLYLREMGQAFFVLYHLKLIYYTSSSE